MNQSFGFHDELDSRRFAKRYDTLDIVEKLNGKHPVGDLVDDSVC